MKLEIGKHYVLANGEVVGPMYQYSEEPEFWYSRGGSVDGIYIGVWKEDGKSDFFSFDQNPNYDIVSEYTK
jgi:hypothetical protein